jgi:hypothetical protein
VVACGERVLVVVCLVVCWVVWGLVVVVSVGRMRVQERERERERGRLRLQSTDQNGTEALSTTI